MTQHDPHPPIPASRADRRTTPRRLRALVEHVEAHRQRRAYRRALARVASQYPTRQGAQR